MAERSWRHRPHRVDCDLSDEEYRQLNEMRAALGQPIRFFLVLGVRHARAAWRREQRRQRRDGE